LRDRGLDEVAGRCRQAGAGYVRLWADDPVEDLLLRGWRQEGLVR